MAEVVGIAAATAFQDGLYPAEQLGVGEGDGLVARHAEQLKPPEPGVDRERRPPPQLDLDVLDHVQARRQILGGNVELHFARLGQAAEGSGVGEH